MFVPFSSIRCKMVRAFGKLPTKRVTKWMILFYFCGTVVGSQLATSSAANHEQLVAENSKWTHPAPSALQPPPLHSILDIFPVVTQTNLDYFNTKRSSSHHSIEPRAAKASGVKQLDTQLFRAHRITAKYPYFNHQHSTRLGPTLGRNSKGRLESHYTISHIHKRPRPPALETDIWLNWFESLLDRGVVLRHDHCPRVNRVRGCCRDHYCGAGWLGNRCYPRKRNGALCRRSAECLSYSCVNFWCRDKRCRTAGVKHNRWRLRWQGKNLIRDLFDENTCVDDEKDYVEPSSCRADQKEKYVAPPMLVTQPPGTRPFIVSPPGVHAPSPSVQPPSIDELFPGTNINNFLPVEPAFSLGSRFLTTTSPESNLIEESTVATDSSSTEATTTPFHLEETTDTCEKDCSESDNEDVPVENDESAMLDVTTETITMLTFDSVGSSSLNFENDGSSESEQISSVENSLTNSGLEVNEPIYYVDEKPASDSLKTNLVSETSATESNSSTDSGQDIAKNSAAATNTVALQNCSNKRRNKFGTESLSVSMATKQNFTNEKMKETDSLFDSECERNEAYASLYPYTTAGFETFGGALESIVSITDKLNNTSFEHEQNSGSHLYDNQLIGAPLIVDNTSDGNKKHQQCQTSADDHVLNRRQMAEAETKRHNNNNNTNRYANCTASDSTAEQHPTSAANSVDNHSHTPSIKPQVIDKVRSILVKMYQG